MIWFVYIDYTTEAKPRPFYVGKGNVERVQRRDRNKHWKHIADKYGWERRILSEHDTEAEALSMEEIFIALIGTFRRGVGGKWGANMTSGSEGVAGYRHTDDARRRIAENNYNKHPEARQALSERQRALGDAHPARREDVRLKNSLAQRGAKGPRVKLSQVEVEMIRASTLSLRVLGRTHGVSPSTIWNVKNKVTWK